MFLLAKHRTHVNFRGILTGSAQNLQSRIWIPLFLSLLCLRTAAAHTNWERLHLSTVILLVRRRASFISLLLEQRGQTSFQTDELMDSNGTDTGKQAWIEAHKWLNAVAVRGDVLLWNATRCLFESWRRPAVYSFERERHRRAPQMID